MTDLFIHFSFSSLIARYQGRTHKIAEPSGRRRRSIIWTPPLNANQRAGVCGSPRSAALQSSRWMCQNKTHAKIYTTKKSDDIQQACGRVCAFYFYLFLKIEGTRTRPANRSINEKIIYKVVKRRRQCASILAKRLALDGHVNRKQNSERHTASTSPSLELP